MRVCAYCKGAIKPGVEVTACSHCGVLLHDDCWQESGRCPTLGCPGYGVTALRRDGRESARPDGRPTRSCPYCGARILAAAVRCRYCRRRLDGVPDTTTGTGFCWWGLLFGALWYLATGMWRKGLVLMALGLVTYGIAPALIAGFRGYEDLRRYQAGEVFWW